VIFSRGAWRRPLDQPGQNDRWLASSLIAPDGAFWIVEMEGAAAGLANLTRVDLIHSRCEWAYFLATPAARGRGLGSCVEYLGLGQAGMDAAACYATPFTWRAGLQIGIFTSLR
jgi:RimJ/RimL family protein N-acetyltransferase